MKNQPSWSIAACVVLGASFFTLAAGCGTDEAADAPQLGALAGPAALFVVGNTTLSAADAAFQQRLTALGLAVTVRQDSAATAADATGKQLVAISSTVASGAVNTKFKNVAVPVLAWESSLLDDMGLTAATSGTDYGTIGSQTQLSVVAPASDPMAAALTGTQAVTSASSTYSWGKPAAGAFVVARLAGGSTRAGIFRYEKGASMVGLAAPERRVAFFFSDTTATVLTSAGKALTDAAIRWAAHLQGAANGAACSSGSGCASGFCPGGVCCNTACTGACVTCSAAGSTGTCTNRPAGTTCGTATCSGSTFTGPSTCDGTGTCAQSASLSCAPYACASSACGTSCTSDAGCVSGFRCVNGRCS